MSVKKRQTAAVFLRRREVSEALHLSLRTVDRMISRGQLKAVRVHGADCVLIPVADVERLVAEAHAPRAESPEPSPSAA